MPTTNQHGFPFNGNVKLKDAALIYVQEGFSVIPLHWMAKNKCSCGRGDCASPAKHPLTQHGLKDASNDPAQVKAWWKQYPKANIGVCTGQPSNGLTVIDIDVAKGGCLDPNDPAYAPITLRVETGNGFHLWFKSDQEIKNSAGKLGQGIDVRGWGGYVVAPPSVHSTGRTYAFRNQDPIAEFPSEILAKLQPEPDDPDLVLSYKSNMADFFPDGQRDVALTSMAGKLRRQGFSQEEIEAALLAANLKRCNPPLTDRQVRKIARSVSRYQPAQQIDTQIEDEPDLILGDDELDDIPIVDQSQTDQDSQPDLPPNPFPNPPGRDPLLGAITLEQLNQTIFGRPEMILQGLSKGDWGLVVGIGSVGKTTFLHNISVCLAAGRPFPPLIPEGQTPRKILYLDFESNPWRLQSQLRILQEVLTDEEKVLVGQNLHFAIEPETNGTPWRLTDIPSLLNLAKYIQKHQIDLVVVDTLAQAASLSDENNNAEVQRKVVTPIRRLVKHCDVAVLLLHHEGKGKQQTGENYTQYKARGASSLIDAARYQITITPADKEKKGQVEVVNSKDKGEGFRAVIMELDQKSRWFSMLGYLNKTLKASDVIMETLEKQTGEVSLDDLSALIPTIAKKTISNNLADLAKSGRVTKSDQNTYRISTVP